MNNLVSDERWDQFFAVLSAVVESDEMDDQERVDALIRNAVDRGKEDILVKFYRLIAARV